VCQLQLRVGLKTGQLIAGEIGRAAGWGDAQRVHRAEELAAMRSPTQCRDEGGRVPNPPIDWSKPHQVMVMPTGAEYTPMSTPDDVVTRTMSEPALPVHVDELQTTS
jgi:hypothetical protein